MNRQKDARLRAVGLEVKASAVDGSSSPISYFAEEAGWDFPALGPAAAGVFSFFSLPGSAGLAFAFAFWILDDFLLNFGDGGLRSSRIHSS